MTMTNAQIAELLRSHADLMEITGESSFRLNAYRKAADAVRGHDLPLAQMSDLTAIPGVGAGISAATIRTRPPWRGTQR